MRRVQLFKTQEVFISALGRLSASEQAIVLTPGLYEIARNACIDHYRHEILVMREAGGSLLGERRRVRAVRDGRGQVRCLGRDGAAVGQERLTARAQGASCTPVPPWPAARLWNTQRRFTSGRSAAW